MALFKNNLFKKALSAVLSLSVAVTGLVPASAGAQTILCSGFDASSGQDARCAARTIGGVPVAYPKLKWEALSEMALAAEPGSKTITGSREAVELGNRAALALNLNSSDVANAATVFPANVPYVFARYNPMDLTLRIDVFKLEKTMTSTGKKAGLYQAVFSPAHGDHWKAGRAYISPDAYKAGMTPGKNPFAAFAQGGDDLFHNITLTGAQVAVGHAMRLAGAPTAVLAVADSRISQKTKKSSSVFKKKVETWVYGHVKTRWFIAQPMEVLQRSTTAEVATICASDPSQTTCPFYETAASGVAFEEFDGGSLDMTEDTFQLDYQKKSGLSFIGALVIGIIGSFALAGVMAAAGIGSAVGGAGAAGAAGTAGGATLGSFGSFLVNQGLVTSISTLGASVAIEATYVAASLALAGANLGSTINADARPFFGSAKVAKGLDVPNSLSKYHQKINNELVGRTRSDLRTASAGASSDPVLTSFRKTVYGDCAPGSKLSECSVNASGVVPRLDQFLEQGTVNFIRDNSGAVIRDNAPRTPNGP